MEYNLKSLKYEKLDISGILNPKWAWKASERKSGDTLASLSVEGAGDSEISADGLLIKSKFTILLNSGKREFITKISNISFYERDSCVISASDSASITVGACAINLRGLMFGEPYYLKTPEPNPVNSNTFTLEYSIAKEEPITIELYNSLGEKARTLIDGVVKGGKHSEEFDVSGLSSGVYFIKITAGAFNETKSVMVWK